MDVWRAPAPGQQWREAESFFPEDCEAWLTTVADQAAADAFRKQPGAAA